MSENDAHVVPSDQDHDASPQCWCLPEPGSPDIVTGGRVWLHRRAHDLPHREADKPRNLGGDWSGEPSGRPPMRGE